MCIANFLNANLRLEDEFDKIKAGFQEQVEAGKVSPETATLFNALIFLVNIILSIFMEKMTKRNSAKEWNQNNFQFFAEISCRNWASSIIPIT